MVTATSYQEKSASVGSLTLRYQEWGEPTAPAVLMLHGFGVSGHMFDEFGDRASGSLRLIALDQRGHGDSDWAKDGEYSREAFVSDIEGFRETLGLESFILIGHSMGGLNAVTYAAQHPSRVRALVLVDVGPESAREGVENIVRFTRGPDLLEFDEFVEMAHRFNSRRSLENIRDRMRHRLKQTDDGKWTWKFDSRFRDKESTLKIGSEMSNDETWQLFRSVATPTLLIRGAESDVLTQETAERVVREMPNARLVLVPGAGHSVPGDNPDDFTASVREFIGEVQEGQFTPDAGIEPLPLEALVESNGHRPRPGMLTFVVAGAAAVIAIGGVSYLVRHNRKQKKERSARAALARSRRITQVPPTVDLEATRVRMASLAADLASIGRYRAAEAVHALRDSDLTPAREQVGRLSSAVGARARHVDRKKLRKRGKAAGTMSKVGALLVARILLQGMSKAGSAAGKASKRRKGRRWRR
jgi:pimeloyl-ACP methyl ester carboxylesterase